MSTGEKRIGMGRTGQARGRQRSRRWLAGLTSAHNPPIAKAGLQSPARPEFQKGWRLRAQSGTLPSAYLQERAEEDGQRPGGGDSIPEGQAGPWLVAWSPDCLLPAAQQGAEVKGTDFRHTCIGLNTELCHQQAVVPLPSHGNSPCHSFLICEMGTISTCFTRWF